MFTGLIESVSTVKSAASSGGSMKLAIDLGKLTLGTKIGDSIAINGVCLTVTTLSGTLATFDVSQETVEKSSLARLTASSKVNTERALRLSDRLGGHVVQGHVDGTAAISTIANKGNFWLVRISAAPQLLDQMVMKGSVTIDGISLTVADIDSKSFAVAIIPQTWNDTTLHLKKTGDIVNIETDLTIKVIKKHLENILPSQNGMTVDKLRELGF